MLGYEQRTQPFCLDALFILLLLWDDLFDDTGNLHIRRVHPAGPAWANAVSTLVMDGKFQIPSSPCNHSLALPLLLLA